MCADAGREYVELRGAVLHGSFEEASGDAALERARHRYAAKYWGGAEVPLTRSHVWLKLVPSDVRSWDFRKIPSGGDVRVEAIRPRDESGASANEP